MRATLIPALLAGPHLSSTFATALQERRLLPAGPAYLAHVRRTIHNLTFEEHDKHAEEERKRFEALNGNGLNGEDDLGVGDEEETDDILLLDPKEWKVGLGHLLLDRRPAHRPRRNKTIMLFLVSPIFVTGQPMIKSR